MGRAHLADDAHGPPGPVHRAASWTALVPGPHDHPELRRHCSYASASRPISRAMTAVSTWPCSAARATSRVAPPRSIGLRREATRPGLDRSRATARALSSASSRISMGALNLPVSSRVRRHRRLSASVIMARFMAKRRQRSTSSSGPGERAMRFRADTAVSTTSRVLSIDSRAAKRIGSDCKHRRSTSVIC